MFFLKATETILIHQNLLKKFCNPILSNLHEKGCKIIIFTARGSKTGKDWKKITIKQLKKYSVSYSELVFGKPGSDFYVDDKSISLEKLKAAS